MMDKIKVKVVFTDARYPNPFSWAIKKFEKADYCHAAYFDGHFWEADAFGISRKTPAQFRRTNIVVEEIEFEVTRAQFLAMHREASRFVGTKYGYCTVAGILHHRLTGQPNPFLDGEKTLFCSEYVHRIISKVGTLKFHRPETDGVRKLYEECLRLKIEEDL
jgi:hypothetical protein